MGSFLCFQKDNYLCCLSIVFFLIFFIMCSIFIHFLLDKMSLAHVSQYFIKKKEFPAGNGEELKRIKHIPYMIGPHFLSLALNSSSKYHYV